MSGKVGSMGILSVQLFLFCEDCGKIDTRNAGPCSRCSSIFLYPIFVQVEEAFR
jgi:predicted ATP-dependent serine protease